MPAPGLEREKLAELCKALGHPVRLQIMEILIEVGHCVTGDLSERLPIAPSTASQHLKVLRNANLIIGEVDGPKRSYCVNSRTLEALTAGLSSLVDATDAAIAGDLDCS